MKRKLIVSVFLALILCLVCVSAMAAEPVVHVTFDGGEEDYILNGGAVVEDGALKLPGGAMRSAYLDLPYAALMDTADQATIAMWMYVPSDTTVNSYFIAFANGNSWPAFMGCVLPSGQVSINFDNRGYIMTEPCFPLDAWTHIAVSISTPAMKIYLNGQRVAMYDGSADIQENCYWNRINGANRGTTHYQELDKVNIPSGWLGTPPYNNYFDLRGDMRGMFDDYRVYNQTLSDEEIASLFASLPVPAASFPIGAAPDAGHKVAEIAVKPAPEDDLRVFYTFDGSDEGYALVNGAKVENGVLSLPGGAFREAGHMELPRNAIANCGKAMTVSTWINLESASLGDQFIFAISADEGWPAIYLMTYGDGTLHYNIDYRSVLNADGALPTGRWTYLTAVLAETEVAIYVDGALFARYDRETVDTTACDWEMLNVQNDSTHFCDLDRVANHTFRVGSAFMDAGYNRVDARADYDNFRVYSKLLTAQDVSALYAAECAETGYNQQ